MTDLTFEKKIEELEHIAIFGFDGEQNGFRINTLNDLFQYFYLVLFLLINLYRNKSWRIEIA